MLARRGDWPQSGLYSRHFRLAPLATHPPGMGVGKSNEGEDRALYYNLRPKGATTTL